MNKGCNICGSKKGRNMILNDLPMRQCVDCGLVWLVAERVRPSEQYNQKSMNLGEEKIISRRKNCRARIALIRPYVHLNALCDIGCGEGVFLGELKAMGFGAVVGIDPNRENVAFARKQGLEVFEGSLEDIDKYASKIKNFHTFTLFHVIEHLNNPHASLLCLYQFMKKGDRLVIETPNFDAYAVKKKNYRHELIHEEHLYYFTPETITLLLKGIGFSVIAKGKRGFAGVLPGIEELLFRLELRHHISHHSIRTAKLPQHETTGTGGRKRNMFLRYIMSVIKYTIRFILDMLVRKMGRVDYMWYIVEK